MDPYPNLRSNLVGATPSAQPLQSPDETHDATVVDEETITFHLRRLHGLTSTTNLTVLLEQCHLEKTGKNKSVYITGFKKKKTYSTSKTTRWIFSTSVVGENNNKGPDFVGNGLGEFLATVLWAGKLRFSPFLETHSDTLR